MADILDFSKMTFTKNEELLSLEKQEKLLLEEYNNIISIANQRKQVYERGIVLKRYRKSLVDEMEFNVSLQELESSKSCIEYELKQLDDNLEYLLEKQENSVAPLSGEIAEQVKYLENMIYEKENYLEHLTSNIELLLDYYDAESKRVDSEIESLGLKNTSLEEIQNALLILSQETENISLIYKNQYLLIREKISSLHKK